MSTSIRGKARGLTLGGAVVAALLASSCCIGPLVLAALGLGGLGAFVSIGSYRPHILSLTAVLLAVGFYLTYRRPEAGPTPDVCGCDGVGRKRKTLGKTALWIASSVVLALAVAPSLLALLPRVFAPARAAFSSSAITKDALIRVQGIDCEACAAPLNRALKKVDGFRGLALHVADQSVTVTYEPAPGRLEAYVAAINELGYEASLLAEEVR